MRVACAFLALTACAPIAHMQCHTRCGMQVLDAPEDFCAQLQPAEDRIIPLLATLESTDKRFKDPCTKIQGWLVEVQPVDSWLDDAGNAVSGQTFCPSPVMWVNNAAPLKGSLAHEMIHAIQFCAPLEPFEPDYYHSNWGPMYKVLGAIQ